MTEADSLIYGSAISSCNAGCRELGGDLAETQRWLLVPLTAHTHTHLTLSPLTKLSVRGVRVYQAESAEGGEWQPSANMPDLHVCLASCQSVIN